MHEKQKLVYKIKLNKAGIFLTFYRKIDILFDILYK